MISCHLWYMCISYVCFSKCQRWRHDDFTINYFHQTGWTRLARKHEPPLGSLQTLIHFTLAQSDNFRAGYLQFATWKRCHCYWNGSCYVGDLTFPCQPDLTAVRISVVTQSSPGERTPSSITRMISSAVLRVVPTLPLFVVVLQRRYLCRHCVSSCYSVAIACYVSLCHHGYASCITILFPRVPVSLRRSSSFSLPGEGYKARLSSWYAVNPPSCASINGQWKTSTAKAVFSPVVCSVLNIAGHPCDLGTHRNFVAGLVSYNHRYRRSPHP